MSPDNTYLPPAPESDVRTAALAEEVRQLKALLEALQAELEPAIQSRLRERSSELQRIGGELAERQVEAGQLRRELDQAQARSADLEREVERWRGAATRGVEEIAERARAAAERFEARTAELDQALARLRAQLETSQDQTQAAIGEREAAARALERSRRRIGSLKAKVLRREARRMQMMRSASWRFTAPLRWVQQALHRLALGGARLRRRLLKR
jgi:chromosome segregation ATPase